MDARFDTRTFENGLGYFPAPPESTVVVACDLGFSIDHAAVTIMERLRLPLDPSKPESFDTNLRQKLNDPVYIVRRIVEFPERTPHTEVINALKVIGVRVKDANGREYEVLLPNAERIVDVTGAQSFRELAREHGLRFTPLTITAGGFGSQSRDSRGEDHASKATLVSELDAALGTKELLLPDDLENGQILLDQLAAFRMQRSAVSGQPTWGGVKLHDDVLMSATYALRALRASRGNSWAVQTWGA
jgi:hypothetical protein